MKFKGKTLNVKKLNPDHRDGCIWFTFKDGQEVPAELAELVKAHGGKVVECEAKPAVVEKPKVNLDLNNDGKVDKKDAKIASKVLNSFKGKKGKR